MAFEVLRIATLATGVGNVRSVVRALSRAVERPKEITLTGDPEALSRADVLVVPGQGSFGAFADALKRDGGALHTALMDRIRAGVPYFGICLGLQILFDESEEAPIGHPETPSHRPGLGVLRGRVRRLNPNRAVEGTAPAADLPLPHIGWNRVSPTRGSIVRDEHYYFAHSYAAEPTDLDVTIATADYGSDRFTCAIARDNVVGVQFHPEKSQNAGLSLLTRFFAAL